ncbi:hypothetical protein [Algibacter sp. PT7-4]|uniref:hypothetical protein n=1 Tax=Algibacter ulvanivorans TaxID=3400999 RepID=UPI003AB0E956
MLDIQNKLRGIQWLRDTMKPKLFTVLAFLVLMGPSLSANTQLLISQGKINPRDKTLVVRNEVSAGGTVDLLQGFNSAIRGINDFNGNQLANNLNFVLENLQLNYGTGATATVGTKYDSVNYTAALPPALKSANLIIEQDEKVIRKISIAAINEAKNTDERWLEIQLALLKSETITGLKIEFGQNAAFAYTGGDDASYVELILKGFETATTY